MPYRLSAALIYVAKITNIVNAGLYQHMHTFQVQQLQSLHPGTPQCKSLQLQASRVTRSNRQQCSQRPVCVHKGCSKAGNVNTTLTCTYQLRTGRYWIWVTGLVTSSIACCLESSMFTSVIKFGAPPLHLKLLAPFFW